MSKKYLDIKKLPDGNLSIKATSAGVVFIKNGIPGSYRQTWQYIILNTPYHQVYPENIGALTDSPMITDSLNNYWWFPDYQVRDEFKELAEGGEIIFIKAENW